MDKRQTENYYKTKKMLNNYLIYKSKIIDLEIENKMLESDIGMRALQYGESTSKTYKVSSNTENTVINNNDKIEKNKKEIEYKRFYINKLNNALNILDNKFEKEVIIKKFLTSSTNSWKDVSIILNNTAEACRKASDRAIIKLSEFLF